MNANTINNKTKCKGKKKIKHNNVTRKLKYMESVGGRRRKRNKGMMEMDGGDPFDTLGYRTKRDQDRLADKRYHKGIKDAKESHEINKNMITLKVGTALVNFPDTPPFFSSSTEETPHYKVATKNGKFVEPTPEQKKELQQILAEKDEKFKTEQARQKEQLDEQDENYVRTQHEAAEAAAEEATKISPLADQVAATPAVVSPESVVLPSSTDAAAMEEKQRIEPPSEDNARKRMREREPDETESNDDVKRPLQESPSSLDVSTPLENTSAVIAASDVPSNVPSDVIAPSASDVIASAPLFEPESAATDAPPNLASDATSLGEPETAGQLQTIEAPPPFAPNVSPPPQLEIPPQSSTPSADADDAAKQQKLAEIESKLTTLTERFNTLKAKATISSKQKKPEQQQQQTAEQQQQQTAEQQQQQQTAEQQQQQQQQQTAAEQQQTAAEQQQQQQEPSQITVEPSQITTQQGGEKHKNKQKKKTLYKKYKSNASLKRRHKTCKNQ